MKQRAAELLTLLNANRRPEYQALIKRYQGYPA
jgi:hypothetical protein